MTPLTPLSLLLLQWSAGHVLQETELQMYLGIGLKKKQKTSMMLVSALKKLIVKADDEFQ